MHPYGALPLTPLDRYAGGAQLYHPPRVRAEALGHRAPRASHGAARSAEVGEGRPFRAQSARPGRAALPLGAPGDGQVRFRLLTASDKLDFFFFSEGRRKNLRGRKTEAFPRIFF